MEPEQKPSKKRQTQPKEVSMLTDEKKKVEEALIKAFKDRQQFYKNQPEEKRELLDRQVEPVQFKSLEYLDSKSNWYTGKLTVEMIGDRSVPFFIKANFLETLSTRMITERLTSHQMLCLHNVSIPNHSMGASGAGLYIVKQSSQQKWDIIKGPVIVGPMKVLPDIDNGDIIFELQHYVEGPSLQEIMDAIPAGKTFSAEDTELIDRLTDAIVRIHKWNDWITYGIDKGKKRALYRDSLTDLVNRISIYVPPGVEHPIIKKRRKYLLWELGEELIEKNLNKFNRLVAGMGDFRLSNIKDTQTGIHILDFHRTPWMDAGYDIGRFLMEFKELFLVTGNSYYKDFTDIFLDAYISKAKDRRIRRAACIGIFSMLLIKVSPQFMTIGSLDLAEELYEDAIKMLRQGSFDWF